jgi:hypothetical protein
MSDSDALLTSLVSGDPQNADKIKAIVDQLRSRGQLGELAQMSGDPGLSAFGNRVQAENQANEVELGRNAMQNRRDDIQQQQVNRQLQQGQNALAETIRYHNMEDQTRQDAIQAKKDLQQDVGQSQNLIDAIGQYHQSPLNNRSAHNIAIMDEVYKQYPTYDDTIYAGKKRAQSNFDTGKQGDLLRGADVAIQHLDTADQLGSQLHNTSYPVLNMGINAWKNFTGSPDIKSFNTARGIVSDEITKFIIGGGGALADREQLQQQLDAANSPEALQKVTNTLRTLMAGQVKGLQGQFVNSGLGTPDEFLKKLNDRTIGALGLAEAQHGAPSNALPGAVGAAGGTPSPGSGPPQGPAPSGPSGLPQGMAPPGAGMQTTAPDGSPITPYSRAGLVTAMRPDRPAPVTPTTEVPGVSIIKKRVNDKGELWALLSDGTEQRLDRQTFR